MPAGIPNALKTDSGHSIYFSLNQDKLQENKLGFGSHSVRTIGSSMGLCDSTDLYCARKSAEAFKQFTALDRQNQELQNLPEKQQNYMICASGALPNPSDNSIKKTDSIFGRMVTSIKNQVEAFIHPSLNSTKTVQPSLVLTHENLLGLVCALYPNAYKGGICQGFAVMGAQAILSGTVDQFNEQLRDIDSFFQKMPLQDKEIDYKKIIEEITTKCKEAGNFNPLAFLEGLELCAQIQKHQELFETEKKPQNQTSIHSVTSASSITASAKLEAKGKLISVANFYGSYIKDELSTYFSSLEKVIRQEPAATTPISFILGTPNHTITVGYDPKEQTWIFFEANKVAVKKCKSSEEIADCVSQVSSQCGYPKYAPLSTRAFALGRDIDPSVLSWEAKLKNWQNSDDFKNIHEVTKDSPKYDSWIQIKQAHMDDPSPTSERFTNLMASINFPGGTPIIDITSLLGKKSNDEKSSVDHTSE